MHWHRSSRTRRASFSAKAAAAAAVAQQRMQAAASSPAGSAGHLGPSSSIWSPRYTIDEVTTPCQQQSPQHALGLHATTAMRPTAMRPTAMTHAGDRGCRLPCPRRTLGLELRRLRHAVAPQRQRQQLGAGAPPLWAAGEGRRRRAGQEGGGSVWVGWSLGLVGFPSGMQVQGAACRMPAASSQKPDPAPPHQPNRSRRATG
jgi:hypothetical protein